MISRFTAKWALIDFLFILLLFIIVVRLFAYGSGLDRAIYVGAHWLATGIIWFANLLAAGLNLL